MSPAVKDDDCRCGDPKSAHDKEPYKPQCSIAGCLCMHYRPKPAATPAVTAPARTPDPAPLPVIDVRPQPPATPTAEQIIAAGKRSSQKRTAALAARVESSLINLRARVLEDAATAKLRQEIEELERTLAAKKAHLKNGAQPQAHEPLPSAAAGESTPDKHLCPECGREFDSPQGVGGHRARAHRRTA